MERPNLGNPCVPVKRDNLPYALDAITPQLSYPLVTSAVITPRQLAPTMGPRPKGVYVMGEALRGMRELAIGEITINSRGERVIDDFGWNTDFDQIETGNIITFGLSLC